MVESDSVWVVGEVIDGDEEFFAAGSGVAEDLAVGLRAFGLEELEYGGFYNGDPFILAFLFGFCVFCGFRGDFLSWMVPDEGAGPAPARACLFALAPGVEPRRVFTAEACDRRLEEGAVSPEAIAEILPCNRPSGNRQIPEDALLEEMLVPGALERRPARRTDRWSL